GTAEQLLRIARMIKLLGADCILAGIQPAVAQTIVTHELELGELRVFQALRDALEDGMRQLASAAK
ncbi:MAG: sigma-B regulator RsbR, partial [Nannocystaceae bacterium]